VRTCSSSRSTRRSDIFRQGPNLGSVAYQAEPIRRASSESRHAVVGDTAVGLSLLSSGPCGRTGGRRASAWLAGSRAVSCLAAEPPGCAARSRMGRRRGGGRRREAGRVRWPRLLRPDSGSTRSRVLQARAGQAAHGQPPAAGPGPGLCGSPERTRAAEFDPRPQRSGQSNLVAPAVEELDIG
jgi:hypothetical protein